MSSSSPRWLSLVVSVSIVTASACQGSAPPADAPVVPMVFDLSIDPAAGIAEVDPYRVSVMPADELRLTIEGYLGWHSVTMVEAMRATARDNGADAWIGALVANTDDIVAAIGLAYGPDAARGFHQQWAQHTQFLVDYAAAVRRDDRTTADEARRRLVDYAKDSGQLIDRITEGKLAAADVTAALTRHVLHMLDQLDAMRRGDVDASTGLALADHAALASVATSLSGVIAARQPMAFIGPVDTPFAEYCSLADRSGEAKVIEALSRSGPEATAAEMFDPFGAVAFSTLPVDLAGGLGAATRSFEAARTSRHAAATVSSAQSLLAAVDATARNTAPTS